MYWLKKNSIKIKLRFIVILINSLEYWSLMYHSFFRVGFLLAIAFSLIACNNDNSSESNSGNVPEESTLITRSAIPTVETSSDILGVWLFSMKESNFTRVDHYIDNREESAGEILLEQKISGVRTLQTIIYIEENEIGEITFSACGQSIAWGGEEGTIEFDATSLTATYSSQDNWGSNNYPSNDDYTVSMDLNFTFSEDFKTFEGEFFSHNTHAQGTAIMGRYYPMTRAYTTRLEEKESALITGFKIANHREGFVLPQSEINIRQYIDQTQEYIFPESMSVSCYEIDQMTSTTQATSDSMSLSGTNQYKAIEVVTGNTDLSDMVNIWVKQSKFTESGTADEQPLNYSNDVLLAEIWFETDLDEYGEAYSGFYNFIENEDQIIDQLYPDEINDHTFILAPKTVIDLQGYSDRCCTFHEGLANDEHDDTFNVKMNITL